MTMVYQAQAKKMELNSLRDLLRVYEKVCRKSSYFVLENATRRIGTSISDTVSFIDANLMENGVKVKELRKMLAHELSQINILRKEVSEPFSIFIMGMGNHGKSTLINALLGEKKAEMDFLPKTWKIDIFQATCNFDEVILRYDDLSDRAETMRSAKKILDEEEMKMSESRWRINSELKKNLSEFQHDLKAMAELKKSINEKNFYYSQIVEVVWPCKRKGILKNFKIIDTPGLNQELLAGDIRFTVADYYNKADGVIWVLDAMNMGKKSINEALNEIGIRDNCEKGNVIGVLNKMDLVEQNSPGGSQKVIEKAEEIYGERFESIIPMSAKQAMEAIVGGDDNLLTSSGYEELLSHIENKFLKNAFEIKISSKLNGLKNYCKNISDIMMEFNSLMDEKISEYREREDIFLRSARDMMEGMNERIKVDLSLYKKKVKNNIDEKTEKLLEFGPETPRFYKERWAKVHIFEENELRRIIEQSISKARQEIWMFYEMWAIKSVISGYRYLPAEYSVCLEKKESYTSRSFNLSEGFQTYLDDAMGVGVLASIVGLFFLGPVALLLPLLGWLDNAMGLGVLKRITIWLTLGRFQNELKEKMTESVISAEKSFSNTVENITNNIIERINHIRCESFSRIYFDISNVENARQIFDELEKTAEINLKPNIRDVLKGEICR